jgi:uncharacterized membrane protein YeiB
MKYLLSSLVYTAVTVAVATIGEYLLNQNVSPLGVAVMALAVFAVNFTFQKYFFRTRK